MATLTKTQEKKIHAKTKALESFLRAAVENVGAFDPQAVCWVKKQAEWRGGYRTLARSMAADALPDSQEFRLNQAGFKLYLHFDMDLSLTAYLGGDQRNDHPEAYLILSMMLRREGLLHDDRFDGNVFPFALNWFEQYWGKLKPWAKAWAKKHSYLIPPIVMAQIGESYISW